MLSFVKVNSFEELHIQVVKAFNGSQNEVQGMDMTIDNIKTDGDTIAGLMDLLTIFKNKNQKGDHNADI